MKSKKIVMPLILSAGLTFAFVSNANAEFLNSGPWQSWAGAYFGAYFGAGSGDADQSFHDRDRDVSIFTSGPTSIDTDVSVERGSGKLSGDITGSKADLFVGYNFNPECANFVLGAQLEGTFFSDIGFKVRGNRKATGTEVEIDVDDDDIDIDTFSSSNSGTAEATDELRSMFSLVARGGFLVAPPVLVYALIGATEGNFVIPGDDNPFGGKRNQWELGYTIGVGVEYKLNENWFLRAEYRYLNFDYDRNQSSTNSSTSVFGTSSSSFTSSFTRHSSTDFDFDLGQIGIVYRF